MNIEIEHLKKDDELTWNKLVNSISNLYITGKVSGNYKRLQTIQDKIQSNKIAIDLLQVIIQHRVLTRDNEKINAIKLLNELQYRIEELTKMTASKTASKDAAKRLGKKFLSSL